MDVGQRSKQLVDVEFDLENGHGSLQFVEVSGCSIDGLGDVFEDEIEVDLIFLFRSVSANLQDTNMYVKIQLTRSPFE